MPHTIEAVEIIFIDPRTNTDKFFRVYLDGLDVYTQYGRNGTSGAWTAPKTAASPTAAQAAADKTLARTTSDGDNPHRAATLTFDTAPDRDTLNAAVNALPVTGEGTMPVLREQAAVVTHTNTAAEPVNPAIQRAVTAALDALSPRTTGNSPALPTRPMLAAVADQADIPALLTNTAWVTQPKLDGDRVVIEVTNGNVAVLNRQGQAKVTNINPHMLTAFRALTDGRWVFDGEVVGRTLHLFDMPAAGPHHDENAAYTTRAAHLAAVLKALPLDTDLVKPVATATSADAKQAMLADAEANHREGVMFRALASTYQPGRRSPDLLKHKFLHDVDAEVVEVGVGGKSNAVLAVYNAHGEQVIIGQVSTIGKGAIAVGDVVEVRFLYIINGDRPALYQPRIVRVRHDKAATDCHLEQLGKAVTNKHV